MRQCWRSSSGKRCCSRAGRQWLYASILFIAVVLFVRYYEQPTLKRGYGEEYREYRRNVRGWVPRMQRWDGADEDVSNLAAHRSAYQGSARFPRAGDRPSPARRSVR